MRALILQQVDVNPPGIWAEALDDAGGDIHVARPDLDGAPDLREYDLVVALGGPQSARAGTAPAWLDEEVEAVREAVIGGVPLLGVCRRLVSSATCDVDALRWGPSAYGFQFHLEPTLYEVKSWLDLLPWLDGHPALAAGGREAFLDRYAAAVPAMRDAAAGITRRWLATAARRVPRRLGANDDHADLPRPPRSVRHPSPFGPRPDRAAPRRRAGPAELTARALRKTTAARASSSSTYPSPSPARARYWCTSRPRRCAAPTCTLSRQEPGARHRDYGFHQQLLERRHKEGLDTACERFTDDYRAAERRNRAGLPPPEPTAESPAPPPRPPLRSPATPGFSMD